MGDIPVRCPVEHREDRSRQTQFKPGREPSNKVRVGTVTVRYQRGDHDRAWIKVGEPNEWKRRAVYVWEAHGGIIPEGFVIHHMNKNALDDRIQNLALISRCAHPSCHGEEARAGRHDAKLNLKTVICSQCNATFPGKYQRRNSLCDECLRTSKKATNRRYKQRLRASARSARDACAS